VNTYDTANVDLDDGAIADKLQKLFDLRPGAIVKRFGLKNPIFKKTAAYGHMGRNPVKDTVTVARNGNTTEKEVELFAWEKLDHVDKIKSEFNI
jgi:S-adenosylmethionine synthetase